MVRSMALTLALLTFPLMVSPSAAALSDAEKPDKPSSYKAAAAVRIPRQQAVLQLKLTRDVYLNAQTEQLGDLRLFDADGKNVPFSLINPMDQVGMRRTAAPVRAFAVFAGHENRTTAPTELEIRTSRDGDLLAVMAKGQSAANMPTKPMSSLILDLKPPLPADGERAKPVVGALQFKLPTDVKTYSAKVAVEVSDDLKSWDSLCESTLDWLVNEQTAETLANNRITLPPTSARYAKLSWLEGQPMEFAQVSAEFVTHTALPQVLDTLLVAPVAGRESDDLLYDSAIAIPVERLALQFKQQNVVFPAAVGQYVDVPTRGMEGRTTKLFRARMRFTFFQLGQGQTQKTNMEIATGDPVHATHWVIRPENASPEKPVLQISWNPATIVFVANGRMPYTLAVGRGAAHSVQLPLSKVVPGFSVQELLSAERAELGPMIAREPGKSEPALEATAAEAAQKRILILWSLLLVGVGALGFMAWKLAVQSRKSGAV